LVATFGKSGAKSDIIFRKSGAKMNNTNNIEFNDYIIYGRAKIIKSIRE
jgi:hypothetical protein